jgi:hypothetical protein
LLIVLQLLQKDLEFNLWLHLSFCIFSFTFAFSFAFSLHLFLKWLKATKFKETKIEKGVRIQATLAGFVLRIWVWAPLAQTLIPDPDLNLHLQTWVPVLP